MNAYLVFTDEWGVLVIAPTPGRAKTLLMKDSPTTDLEFVDICRPRLIAEVGATEGVYCDGPLYCKLIDECPHCGNLFAKGKVHCTCQEDAW